MANDRATLARQRLSKIAAAGKAHPRPVDFHANKSDFMVTMLFSIGMESNAIADLTNLTIGQVNYRLQRYEWQVRQKAKQSGKDFVTARKAYRKGNSHVSKMIISQITGNHSLVKRYVQGVLDQRGLYNPVAKGVLTDEKD